jgi:hypothetical protein
MGKDGLPQQIHVGTKSYISKMETGFDSSAPAGDSSFLLVSLLIKATGEVVNELRSEDVAAFVQRIENAEGLRAQFLSSFKSALTKVIGDAQPKIPEQIGASPNVIHRPGKKIMPRRQTHVHSFNAKSTTSPSAVKASGEVVGIEPAMNGSNGDSLVNEEELAGVENNRATVSRGNRSSKKIMPRRPTHMHSFNGAQSATVTSATILSPEEKDYLSSVDVLNEEYDDEDAEVNDEVDEEEENSGVDHGTEVLLSRVESAECQLAMVLMDNEKLKFEVEIVKQERNRLLAKLADSDI